MHLGVSFYPLNNAKKLKKATEKIMNHFNPASVFIEFSYIFFCDFLGILGLKNHPEPTTLKRVDRHTGSHF